MTHKQCGLRCVKVDAGYEMRDTGYGIRDKNAWFRYRASRISYPVSSRNNERSILGSISSKVSQPSIADITQYTRG